MGDDRKKRPGVAFERPCPVLYVASCPLVWDMAHAGRRLRPRLMPLSQ